MNTGADNLSEKYLKRARKATGYLKLIPSVMLVGVSGSLANGRVKSSSDIDFFIVSRRGRIFTTRFFSKIILRFLRIERKNHDPNPAGKICLNYFLTEESLDFKPHNSKVIAFHQKSIILFSRGEMLSKLIKANRWLKPRFELKYYNHRGTKGKTKDSQRIVKGRRGGNSFFGDALERWLKGYQIRRIEADPITKKYPLKIIYNDRELRFHPPK